jgi:hypothetical protein
MRGFAYGRFAQWGRTGYGDWLEHYALFLGLKDRFGGAA